MLANAQQPLTRFGTLGRDVLLPDTSLYELISFIGDELPRWRDRPERKQETSENILSSQLCAHLNSAARRSGGWDFLQFRIEEPDEHARGRKIDMVPAPSDATVWVNGRHHVDFDALMPIECKRLPTPRGNDRDMREYVFSKHSSTGGIERFKAGHHGAHHKLGAMIAYVQKETCSFWSKQIGEWIAGLIADRQLGWTAKDLLQLQNDDTSQRTALLTSTHSRQNGLADIELRHLWIQMH